MTMFVPIIFTLMGFISNDLLFTCFRLHTICFPLSHFVSEVQSSLLISLLFASDNQPKVTEAIKTILKDDYNYDSTVRIFLLVAFSDRLKIPRTPSEHSIAPLRNAALLKMTEIWCFTRTGMDRQCVCWLRMLWKTKFKKKKVNRLLRMQIHKSVHSKLSGVDFLSVCYYK